MPDPVEDELAVHERLAVVANETWSALLVAQEVLAPHASSLSVTLMSELHAETGRLATAVRRARAASAYAVAQAERQAREQADG